MSKKNKGIFYGSMFLTMACWIALVCFYFSTTEDLSNIALAVVGFILISILTFTFVFVWDSKNLNMSVISIFLCVLIITITMEKTSETNYGIFQMIHEYLYGEGPTPMEILFSRMGRQGMTAYFVVLAVLIILFGQCINAMDRINHDDKLISEFFFMEFLGRTFIAAMYSFDGFPCRMPLPFTNPYALYLDTMAVAYIMRYMLQNYQVENYLRYHFVTTEEEFGVPLDQVEILNDGSVEVYDYETAAGSYDPVIFLAAKCHYAERFLGKWWTPADDDREVADWHVVTFESRSKGKVIVLRYDAVKHEWSFISDQRILKSVCRRFLEYNMPDCLADEELAEMC